MSHAMTDTTSSKTCCVCGGSAGRWRQHWNRDTGYGVCMPCIRWLRQRGTSEAEIADLYGQEGVHFGEAGDEGEAPHAA